jgi:hypothetical protein
MDLEQSSANGIDYHEFCGTISGRQEKQLFLTVSKKDSKLYQTLRPNFIRDEAWMLTAPNSPPMSLREVLAKGKLRGDPRFKEAFSKVKTIVSYLLVKGVWQFYDSELMPTPWTKDTVEFLLEWRERRGLLTAGVFLNQPLISANFGPSSGNTSGRHRYPKIQELGNMLVEIQLEREIESFRGDPDAAGFQPRVTGRAPPLTDYDLANWLFKTKVQADTAIFKPMKEVIGRCLQDQDILNAVTASKRSDKLGSTSGSLIRKAVYNLLVLPLESMIQKDYDDPFDVEPLPEQDAVPVHVAEDSDPPKPAWPGPRPPEQPFDTGHFGSRSATLEVMDVHADISYVAWHSRNLMLSCCPQLLTLQVRQADVKLGERWLDDLDKVHGLLQAEENLDKVKVAVLDTGFSPEHGNLPYDIDPGKYKDFVDEADDERRDLTGHGTTIARLILHVLDEVDLYVGRVFKSEKTVDESFDLLEKVTLAGHLHHWGLLIEA